MRNALILALIAVMTSSCSIYRKYHRPEELPVYRMYMSELIDNPEDT